MTITKKSIELLLSNLFLVTNYLFLSYILRQRFIFYQFYNSIIPRKLILSFNAVIVANTKRKT